MMENRQKGTFLSTLKNKIIACINIWDRNLDTLKKNLHALMGKEKQPDFFLAKIRFFDIKNSHVSKIVGVIVKTRCQSYFLPFYIGL